MDVEDISVTPASSSTDCASPSLRTLQRRRGVLQQVEELVCGSQEAAQSQRAFTIANSSQEEREQLLLSANVHFYVQPDEAVSLAANLRLTNEQVRKLRLWSKKWNVHIASERRTRNARQEKMGDVEVAGEMVQAIIHEEDGSRTFRPAPFAWVRNPHVLVEQHLSSLLRQNLLTWHSRGAGGPALPEDEIWIKIGGDKGGNSFKLAFQVANQPKPNTAYHTVVFLCLGADNLINLHAALDLFKDFVHDLQQLQWR